MKINLWSDMSMVSDEMFKEHLGERDVVKEFDVTRIGDWLYITVVMIGSRKVPLGITGKLYREDHFYKCYPLVIELMDTNEVEATTKDLPEQYVEKQTYYNYIYFKGFMSLDRKDPMAKILLESTYKPLTASNIKIIKPTDPEDFPNVEMVFWAKIPEEDNDA